MSTSIVVSVLFLNEKISVCLNQNAAFGVPISLMRSPKKLFMNQSSDSSAADTAEWIPSDARRLIPI